MDKKINSLITSTLAAGEKLILSFVPFLLFWVYVEIVGWKRRRSARALHYRPFDEQYDSPIYKLPVEILQSIASTLSPAGAAAFALSSRPILFAIGEECLKMNKIHRLEFLGLFESESPDYLLCQECSIFHRRTALGKMDRTRDGQLHKHGELYASSPLERGHGFLFKDGQLIMNRHHLGSPHGPYVEEVTKYTTLESPSLDARAWQHEELRMVEDKLLLQTHTGFQFHKDNARGKEWAHNFRVFFCPHISIHNAPKTYPDQIHIERYLKCKSCYTEIRLRIIALDDYREEYSVTQWFNLGGFRTRYDPHWQAIAAEPNLREVQYIGRDKATIKSEFEWNDHESIEMREMTEDFEKTQEWFEAWAESHYKYLADRRIRAYKNGNHDA